MCPGRSVTPTRPTLSSSLHHHTASNKPSTPTRFTHPSVNPHPLKPHARAVLLSSPGLASTPRSLQVQPTCTEVLSSEKSTPSWSCQTCVLATRSLKYANRSACVCGSSVRCVPAAASRIVNDAARTSTASVHRGRLDVRERTPSL
eukprot:1062382-Rhodomonas_salina.3